MRLQRHLWILDCGAEELPVNTALKVAFATTDRKYVNQHFGSASAFVIYSVSQEQARLVEFAQFGDRSQDGHEDKLAAKLELLQGCDAVYCQAVGGSAIRQLLAASIQPVKVGEGALIDHLLGELKAELQAGPSAWLAKAIERRDKSSASRFDTMETEGWQE